MAAYYNEIDPYAAQWLRNLITAGQIAAGDVDERSIKDVKADDLKGYIQAHFFAGIGGWSVALRLAEWPDDRPVWTGSCPCQPLSGAGKGMGTADDRHLWPEWHRLIRACRPIRIFGEQVASKDGLTWLDIVCADMEKTGYALGAVDLCAAGVGAPHIRQRLWFVADADGRDTSAEGLQRSGEHGQRTQDGRVNGVAVPLLADRRSIYVNGEDGRDGENFGRQETHSESRTCSEVCALADTDGSRCGEGWPGEEGGGRDTPRIEPTGLCDDGGMANVSGDGRKECGRSGLRGEPRQEGPAIERSHGQPWADLEWLECTDGKARPTQPGLFPLAHGVQRRTSKLRAYGNAIVPQVAAEFILAACP